MIVVPAASDPLVGVAASVTVGSTGATSLSVIATLAVLVPPSAIPDDGFAMVKTAVSSPSTSASSATCSVTLADVAPFAMVKLAGTVPTKSLAVSPVPPSDSATVCAPVTAADAVAVSVIVVPAASDPAVGVAASVTVGSAGPARRISTPLISGFCTIWTKSMSTRPSVTCPVHSSMPPVLCPKRATRSTLSNASPFSISTSKTRLPTVLVPS